MTLLQLQYFKTLARVLHYTRAAEELHIAQPSLSYSISELEKELGVRLFVKEKRSISLTLYGQQFLPYVEKSLSTLAEGTEVLKQLAGTSIQVVRLGYFHSISASLIPSIMEKLYLQPENEKLRIQFTEDTSFDIFSLLKKGELDLAFGMHQDEWTESVTIMKQPLYLAVPADHPLACRTSVKFSDFAQEPQIMLDKPSSLRTQMDRVYSRRDVIPRVVFEVRECNTALQYVALRFGVAVLPQVPAMESEKVSIIPIAEGGNEFVRTVYFSWARSNPLSPAAQRVRDYIVEHYAIPDGDPFKGSTL